MNFREGTPLNADQISRNMRIQAEKLLAAAGSRTDPFEGKRLGSARRLIAVALSYNTARQRNVDVNDLVDYVRLFRPVRDNDGRVSPVSLWSENVDLKNSTFSLKKGFDSPIELTSRGGVINWDYETQASYQFAPYSLDGVPSRGQGIEIHRLVQKEVLYGDLLVWQDILNRLAREAFRVV